LGAQEHQLKKQAQQYVHVTLHCNLQYIFDTS